MGCCGKNSSGTVQSFAANPRMHGSQSGGYESGVTFEYLGSTALTAIGGVTGRRYQFSESGACVTTDRRDFLSLLQIPMLRQIR